MFIYASKTNLFYSFRYRVRLHAPTAMVKPGDETPITYLNKGQLYWISIVDTTPPRERMIKYRTSIRITFDTEGRENPIGCWQRWKETHGINEAHQRGGKLQAVECSWEDLKPSSCVNFRRAFVDGFSVEWLAEGYGDLECNLPVKFHFLSTDFSHSNGVEGVLARLCVKTEHEPLFVSTMPEEATELCYCRVKLFNDYGAEKQMSTEVLFVKLKIKLLKKQIYREEAHLKRSANAYQTGSVPRSTRYNVKGQWKNWCDEEKLQLKLQTLLDRLLRAESVSYLNLPGDEHDDPDLYPISIESEWDELRDRGEDTKTSFWTSGNQNYRTPSLRSRSSSMNSSLHGTPTFDPEEQNPVFVNPSRPRLQKSPGYYNEPSAPPSPSVKIGPYDSGGSSACIPPPRLSPPRHTAELWPHVDPSSSIVAFHPSERRPHGSLDELPTLPPPPVELVRNTNSLFDCDICGETIQIDSPREWQ